MMLLVFCPPIAAAEDGAHAAEAFAQKEQLDAAQRLQTPPAAARLPETAPTEHWDNEKLVQAPQLFHRLLASALDSGDAHLLESLLAAYRKLPEADPLLLAHAEAELLRRQGKTAESARRYAALQARHPDDIRIRLDAGAVLAEDKQWREADALFESALREEGLPETVADNIRLYRQAIAENNQWRFSGSLGLAHRDNINNVPPPYCTPLGCTDSRPLSAWGLDYTVEAAKNTPIKGHHNLLFRAHAAGTTYYFSRQSPYDHAFGRVYLGWQRQTADSTLNLLPFYQFQLSGSHEFADKPTRERALPHLLMRGGGVQAGWTHTLNPHLQYRLGAEGSVQRYQSAERRLRQNGRHYSLNAALTYAPSSNHSVFAAWGGGLFRPERRMIGGETNNQAHLRHTVSAGWQAHWPQLGGLESGLRVSHTWRRYRGVAWDADFVPRQRKNGETALRLTLAHRQLAWRGLMPQLVYEQERVRSTHKWAERRARTLFVEAVKRF